MLIFSTPQMFPCSLSLPASFPHTCMCTLLHLHHCSKPRQRHRKGRPDKVLSLRGRVYRQLQKILKLWKVGHYMSLINSSACATKNKGIFPAQPNFILLLKNFNMIWSNKSPYSNFLTVPIMSFRALKQKIKILQWYSFPTPNWLI